MDVVGHLSKAGRDYLVFFLFVFFCLFLVFEETSRQTCRKGAVGERERERREEGEELSRPVSYAEQALPQEDQTQRTGPKVTVLKDLTGVDTTKWEALLGD